MARVSDLGFRSPRPSLAPPFPFPLPPSHLMSRMWDYAFLNRIGDRGRWIAQKCRL